MARLGEIKRGGELGYKYHSNKYIWTACPDCGKERWVRLHKTVPTHYYCRHCIRVGERSCTWKGGKKISGGYIKIWLSPDDFFYPMTDIDGYVFEHRLVMAKKLSRNLHSWELVHHKGIRYNGIKNKQDNLEDNLQLVSEDKHNQITILQRKIDRQAIFIQKLKVEIKLLKQRLGE